RHGGTGAGKSPRPHGKPKPRPACDQVGPSPTGPGESARRRMSRWAVVVVHGVGDTGPGVTVDTLLPCLMALNDSLRPDGAPEVRWLPEPRPPASAAPLPNLPQPATPPLPPEDLPINLFPVHVRHARATAPLAGKPAEATFAEVYWADLARVGEGAFTLMLRLLSAVFLLRFIPDWAARQPGPPWRLPLLLLLPVASWLLYGPAAALSAFVAFTLAVYYFVVEPLHPPDDLDKIRRTDELAMALLSGAAALLGLFVWYRCRVGNWGTTW